MLRGETLDRVCRSVFRFFRRARLSVCFWNGEGNAQLGEPRLLGRGTIVVCCRGGVRPPFAARLARVFFRIRVGVCVSLERESSLGGIGSRLFGNGSGCRYFGRRVKTFFRRRFSRCVFGEGGETVKRKARVRFGDRLPGLRGEKSGEVRQGGLG